MKLWMLLLINVNLIGLMNSFYLFFLLFSLIISQNEIITKEFKFYKSNEVEEIDFSSVLNFINGNYAIEIIDINNINFKKIKRTLIENCDLNFSLSHSTNDIKVSRCKDNLSYNGNIVINDNDSRSDMCPLLNNSRVIGSSVSNPTPPGAASAKGRRFPSSS